MKNPSVIPRPEPTGLYISDHQWLNSVEKQTFFPGQSSVTNQTHLSEFKVSQVEQLLGINIIRSRKMGKEVLMSFSKSGDTDPAYRKRFPVVFPRSSSLFHLLWALSVQEA